MKTLFPNFCTLLLLSLSVAGPAGAAVATPAARAATVASTADEELFTRLVNEVGAAIEKKNVRALADLMAPEYTHYNPAGGTGHKADELAYIATWSPTTVKTVGPVQVSRAGNMAVTVSKAQYSMVDNGKTMSHTVQHMIAWSLHDGKWQMSLIQSKEVPA